jgi:hypothetical protein
LTFAEADNFFRVNHFFLSVTSVFAIILGFFCSALTDFALVLERYQVASIFRDTIAVGTMIRAATSATVYS